MLNPNPRLGALRFKRLPLSEFITVGLKIRVAHAKKKTVNYEYFDLGARKQWRVLDFFIFLVFLFFLIALSIYGDEIEF